MKPRCVFGLAAVISGLVLGCDSNEAYLVEPFPVGREYALRTFATVTGNDYLSSGAHVRLTFLADNSFNGRSSFGAFWGSYQALRDGRFSVTHLSYTEGDGASLLEYEEFLEALQNAQGYTVHGEHLLIFAAISRRWL